MADVLLDTCRAVVWVALGLLALEVLVSAWIE
jgi:hypothetical protein